MSYILGLDYIQKNKKWEVTQILVKMKNMR